MQLRRTIIPFSLLVIAGATNSMAEAWFPKKLPREKPQEEGAPPPSPRAFRAL